MRRLYVGVRGMELCIQVEVPTEATLSNDGMCIRNP